MIVYLAAHARRLNSSACSLQQDLLTSVCKSGSAFAWYSLASATKQRWFEHGQSIRRSHHCKTFTMTVEHLTRISSPMCTGRNELGKYEWRYKPADKCVYSKRGLSKNNTGDWKATRCSCKHRHSLCLFNVVKYYCLPELCLLKPTTLFAPKKLHIHVHSTCIHIFMKFQPNLRRNTKWH